MKITLNQRQYFDCINLADGLFSPISGFLDAANFKSVVSSLSLLDGSPWIYPVSLDVDDNLQSKITKGDCIGLFYKNQEFGFICVTDIFKVDNNAVSKALFGTTSMQHPGVANELQKSKTRIAGEIKLKSKGVPFGFTSVSEIRGLIEKTGAKSFVGFQTRNPPHRAHEYIHRTVLEIFDGLLINPLTGWRKPGDFSEQAVITGYNAMLKNYYQDCNVILKPLKTTMLYAGPKEAVHHALLRRNMGCTHFVVGRDHAGVSGFYGNYEAHDFIKNYTQNNSDLGIKIILMKEPVFCKICGHVVSEKSCGHHKVNAHERISGSQIRQYIKEKTMPPNDMIRSEIIDSILKMDGEIFIKEESK